ncbi:BlaI/MecI/CopY family transcriptional regulator [Pseudactinotalea sp. Z1748]|uniref:BlaI/MecI/CopY family transcriptional regulator n=1 Tax=Pseudactinotalea sp. Z1748 TaxID=3413027 RepID=UPI003C7DC8EA
MSSGTRERPGGPVRLGTLEAQVMDVLWTSGAATVREIIAELPAEPAYTTIATVLSNLERKGMVDAKRQGRFVLHRPRMSREQHIALTMGRALDAGGDRAASIMHFVQTMPEQDRELLREYLQHDDDGARR